MKLIIGEPGSGKTKEILALSSINNVPILCESEERVSRLITKAQGYGYKIPTPIVYNQVDESVKTVYVDDIERLLKAMLPCNVDIITYNAEDKGNIKKTI